MSFGKMETRAREVLELCLGEVKRVSGESLSVAADRAYVYVDKEGSWVIFSHGEIGSFGQAGQDSGVIYSCGVLNGPPAKAVFLGAPLKDALIDEPGREYFDTPEGTTEILFKREGEEFNYCCSQPFDEKNFDKHNPDFPWTGQVGS